MANDNKNYIYKDDTGAEHGPYDEATFQSLGTNGTILPHYQVRSTLIPVWEKAAESRVLKKVLAGVLQQQAEAHATGNKWTQLRARINKRGDYDPMAEQLAREGIVYDKASFLFRFLAGVFDLGIIAVISVALLFLCWLAMKSGLLSSLGALRAYAYTTAVAAGLYYAFFINRSGQTLGQRFWGLVITKGRDHQPVYMCRALFFAILLGLCNILSPLFWLLTGCRATLQELLTNTRVYRITIARRPGMG